jgi:hypothetical protein
MFDLRESRDGLDFYYVNHTGASGIWRRPVSGGPPTLLKGTEALQLYRYWTLAGNKIFFVAGPGNRVAQCFDLATGHISRLASIGRGIVRGPRGLAVSPDGSEIIYTSEDLTLSDIMLVENFGAIR